MVVCTHNGRGRIKGTLEALVNQTSENYEVVVVDDGSTDGVGEVIVNHDVRSVRLEQNVGLSAARNVGIQVARGEIVAFCDDDCVPGADWVENIEKAWEAAPEGVCGIGGGVVARTMASVAQRYAEAAAPLAPIELDRAGGVAGRFLQYLKGGGGQTAGRFVASLVGANMSYTREALTAVGGFDEAIKFGGDEEKLCQRLRERYGERCLWVEPGILMQHEYDPRIKDTFRRARAYGRGSGREWARGGGLPSVRPGVLLVMAGAVVGSWAGWMLGGNTAAVGSVAGVLVVGPYLLAGRTVKGRGAEKFLYPHLTILLEAVNTIGFYQGWRAWRSGGGDLGGGRRADS